jgi:hypothetical protein
MLVMQNTYAIPESYFVDDSFLNVEIARSNAFEIEE